MEEYKKSLEDEIDWKIIDQLHTATSTFSTSSIELKRIYLTLIVIAVPTIIKLSKEGLDYSLFITLILITITFWYLDGYTFFYQEKLREKIDSKIKEIRIRNHASSDDLNQEDTIENSRKIGKSNNIWHRFKRSFIGHSVLIYPIIGGLSLLGISLLYFNII